MHLPVCFAAVILTFAPVFLQQRTWRNAELLLIGAILAPGKRTVTSLLRITGLSQERRFTNYHRVLSRTVSGTPMQQAACCWNSNRRLRANQPCRARHRRHDRAPSRQAHQRAKGIYRDPVRSSKGHFVKASGLRWLSLMLLAPIPWAGRVWALPFLTVLTLRALLPRARQAAQAADGLGTRSACRYVDGCLARGRTAWGQQLRRSGSPCGSRPPQAGLRHPSAAGCGPLRSQHRPQAGDGRATADQGARLPTLAAFLARENTRWMRVTVPGWYGEGDRDVEICSATAVWRHTGLPVLPVLPIRWVLLRDPLHRFDPQALLCTDPAREPLQIARWFVQRWQVEVTFREVRDHLGVETQRQWSHRAVARTTPCLLALFSIVTLLAARLDRRARSTVHIDAWYRKPRPTFTDALAAVRRQFWHEQGLLLSGRQAEARKLRPTLRNGIAYALCHAA